MAACTILSLDAVPRVLSVTLGAMLLAGCGPSGSSSSASDTDNGTETVHLTVTHRSEWRVLWIEGETDLPDGAYVNYQVTHALAQTEPTESWPTNNLISSGRAAVKDGGYWARINTINWPAGEVSVVAQFPLPPQPSDVVERYGEFGEHLTGDNVVSQFGIRSVEVAHRFEHRP